MKKIKKGNLIITIVIIILICGFFFRSIISEKEIEKHKNKISFSDTIPNGLGVNIHFTGNRIDMDLIKDAGFKIVRQDITWGRIEKERGVFDFEGQGYDELTSSLVHNGIKPYYILDYSNKLYEKNQSIVTKKGQDAFVRYVSEVTSRYKNKGIIWEIWNEPNTAFWEPKPNIKEYSSLVKRVSKTIKKNDPSGIVVAPALAGLTPESLNWLESIFKKGVLNYIDAVSVHPYRSQSPETALYDYQSLKTLINKYTKKEIPILSGEWGYSTGENWMGLQLNEQQQAEYFVRMFLINLMADVPITIWYDWKNDGNDPSNGEHNFGIRQNDINIPKQAYTAINAFTYNLSGFKFNKRIYVGSSNDYVLEFKNNQKKTIIICWTTVNKHYIELPFNYKKGKVITMYGKENGDIKEKTKVSVEVSSEPKYIISH
ncbi:family 1 glycosylhydrolase [Priestia megaterium]|uniref:Glycosyl hydrolase, family 5 n=1 Tax=Priestia megaterium (strain DSM 319 / IMG 1521) TaxID=592022 RepID=D5DBJ2_PRIM3|nr:family 1 glycosylhydrolase [Priestia megaterium]ADF37974.1 glycosyl hydrolase, family 5 [Priestia megaterium DSM 319]MED4217271.1 family 1 glycosylhydrolase [Priestia megaterium]